MIFRFVVREREVLIAFLGTRLLLWIVAWLSFYWFVHIDAADSAGTQLWNLLSHSDALQYRDIVNYGYNYQPDREQNVGFFPVLPLLISGLKAVTGLNPLLAGFLISNAALLSAAIFLRRLVALDFPSPSRVPERTVWFLLLCPMTFFHSSVYTESLVLMFSILAILWARQRRWAGAGLTGAILTGTHGNAILFLVPLILEALIQRSSGRAQADGISQSRWWLLAVPAGLVAYSTFLYVRFGDPLAFWRAQRSFGRIALPPWDAFRIATDYAIPDGHFLIASAAIGLLLCIALFCMGIRHSYAVYAAAMLGLCLCTTWYSLPRYLSVVFPFYLVLAAASSRSESLYVMLIASSVGLMTICIALYVIGYPII